MTHKSALSGMSPQDGAAYWLARQDADASAATDAGFVAWLNASEDNAAAWARAQAVWLRAAEDLQDDPLTEALRASALAARPPVWPKALAAACAAVALIGAFAGWRYGADRFAPAPAVAPAATPALQLATRLGERRAVTLADGTRLDLDSDTRVEVAIDGEARRLRLARGQAYVQVAHDAARPFTIDVGDQTIVDRGTAFSVRMDPGKLISVTLAQGLVMVGPRDGASQVLEPGQRLMLQRGLPARVETVDLTSAMAWRDGFIEFSDTPLAQAAAEMNRYGGPKIVVDSNVGGLKVSGRFRLGEPERFLRTVSALLPVRATPNNGVLEVRAAPAPSETAG